MLKIEDFFLCSRHEKFFLKKEHHSLCKCVREYKQASPYYGIPWTNHTQIDSCAIVGPSDRLASLWTTFKDAA